MTDAAFQLYEHPDWARASQNLLNGLASLPSSDARIDLLESVCSGLGERLYPAFLQILQYIEMNAEYEAKQLISETLVNCLLCGRLPTGSVAAWGSSGTTGDQAFGQSRRLGPIEYVCVWYAQGGQSGNLTEQQLRAALSSLLRLISTEDRARELYIHKLRSDASDPLSGSLASKTRQGLDALATAWEGEPTGQMSLEPFFEGLQPISLLDQIARDPKDFLPD